MKTAALSLLLAPALMATSYVIPPPPRVVLEGQIQAYSTGQLFDRLAALHRSEQYCIQKYTYESNRRLQELKASVTSDFGAYVNMINCTMTTLDSEDAKTVLETAMRIGKEKWSITGLPRMVVVDLYDKVGYFHAWARKDYRESAKRTLSTVRAIAQQHDIPNADLEQELARSGFSRLGIFAHYSDYNDERELRKDLQGIARKNRIDWTPLEKQASSDLHDRIRGDLEYNDVERTVESIKTYPDWKISKRHYAEAWQFARDLGRDDEKSARIAAAATARVELLLPHFHYPQIKAEVEKTMDFALLVTSDIADGEDKRRFIELRKKLQALPK
jgi:hypothetical protein